MEEEGAVQGPIPYDPRFDVVKKRSRRRCSLSECFSSHTEEPEEPTELLHETVPINDKVYDALIKFTDLHFEEESPPDPAPVNPVQSGMLSLLEILKEDPPHHFTLDLHIETFGLVPEISLKSGCMHKDRRWLKGCREHLLILSNKTLKWYKSELKRKPCNSIKLENIRTIKEREALLDPIFCLDIYGFVSKKPICTFRSQSVYIRDTWIQEIKNAAKELGLASSEL